MTVLNLDDYRPPETTGPVRVSFLGFEYRDDAGEYRDFDFVVDVGDGNYQFVIDAIREMGGLHLTSDSEPVGQWFFPWPCRTVRIEPNPEQTR